MPAKQYRPGWQGKGYGTEYIKKARKRKQALYAHNAVRKQVKKANAK